ncbi:MAG: hypothetical protein ACXABY_25575 [Candidatus Thorarchaeota archaeon]|jgi:hypothetical protein
MKARMVTLKVTLEKPEDVYLEELIYEVDQAIRSMTGNKDPMERIADFDKEKVRVTLLRLPKYKDIGPVED